MHRRSSFLLPNHGPRSLWWLVLALLAGLAVAAGLHMNRHGVDVEPDSATYVTAGLRCAHGEGVSGSNLVGPPDPLLWFPPGVPWMVALCEWWHGEIRVAFGVFNALAWGLLTAWTGWLARRCTGGKMLPGWFAAGVILTSGALGVVHGMLYSEPPFLLFALGALAALAAWWERPDWRGMVLAGACVAGALLLRYVGVTLILLGLLVVLARPGQKWPRRIGTALLFLVVSDGPIFAWHLWQKIVRHGSSERYLAWHPITPAQIREGMTTLATFVVPEQWTYAWHGPRLVAGLSLLLLVGALWRGWQRSEGRAVTQKLAAIPALVGICAGFMAIYGVFLVVSISLADATTPLDQRILSILVPPGAIVTAYLAWVAVWQRGGRWSRGGLTLFLLGLLVLQGNSTLDQQICRQEILCPPGYQSALLDAVRALPPDAMIFSTEPCSLYLMTQRRSESLPDPLPPDVTDASSRADFQQQMARMQKLMSAHGGWVVVWNGLESDDPVLDEPTVRQTIPVIAARHFADGDLLQIGSGSND